MNYYYGDPWVRAITGDQSNGVSLNTLASAVSLSYVGYCDSDLCQRRFKMRRINVIEKPIPGNQLCPVCRSALFWRKKEK